MNKPDRKYTSRMMILVFADVLTIILSYMTALMARFDFHYNRIPEVYTDSILRFLPAAIAIYLVVYWLLKLYHSIWRYASAKEVQRIIIAYLLIAGLLICLDLIPIFNIPRSVLFYGYVGSMMFCVAIRFGYRILRSWMADANNKGIERERAMIIGAGYSGVSLLKNKRFTNHYRVVALIDDNPSTWGKYLEGVRVEGGRDKIRECADKYRVNTIIFAIPSAAREVKSGIIQICKDTGCKLQTVPGIGSAEASKLNNVSIGDMLGRDMINPNRQATDDRIFGKTVMVTGAAGTVGSALALRIAEARPREIILVDLLEPGLYELKRKITRIDDSIRCRVIYGNCAALTQEETGRADYVFHAAFLNNMADRNHDRVRKNNVDSLMGVRRFSAGAEKLIVLTWSATAREKAITGAQEENRMMEMSRSRRQERADAGRASGRNPADPFDSPGAADRDALEGFDGAPKSPEPLFVRMGYVLGTKGDLVSMFQHQIEEGGPVTVPDANMVRSYITPEEAAERILMAAFSEHEYQETTIDPGVPVRVDELARDLIKLNGYKEGEMKVIYAEKPEGYR